MAKINPIKTRQEAEKAEKAGRLEQAIPLYRMLLEDNPRDWNTINKIGDLYAKIGKMREAADEYSKVAEFYAKDGFHLKAIAIWKKINKLDPSAIESYARLAELYAKQGLIMEAKGQYQVVAEDQMKRGRLKEAAETLRKMVEIDPSDLRTRSRLADIYTREGSTDRAVGEYIAISDELNRKGHPAEAIQVLEKGLKIDTGIMVKAQLGRVHLAQRSYPKAIAYLEEVTAQESKAESLMQLGQAYLGAKRVTDAQSTLESVLERSPGSQEARVILAQIYALQARPDDAYDTVLPLVEQLLLKRDLDRAMNLLGQITARSPQHVRTLQKVVEVARIRQNDKAIVEALTQLLDAHVAAGSDRAAEDTAAQMVDVEPNNQQFKARLESLRKKKSAPAIAGPAKVASGAVSEADQALPPPVVSEGTSDLDGLQFDTGAIVRPAGATDNGEADEGAADKEFIDEHLAESRVFRKYGLLDKAEEQVDLVLARFPDIFDARFEKKEVLKETDRPEEAARECLWLAAVALREGNESLATLLSDEAQELSPGISDAPADEIVGELPSEDLAAARIDSDLQVSLEGPAEESELTLGALQAEPVTSFDLGPEVTAERIPAQEPPAPTFDDSMPATEATDEEEELDVDLGIEDDTEEAGIPAEVMATEVPDIEEAEPDDAEREAALAAGFGDMPSDADFEPPSLTAEPDESGPDLDFADSMFRPEPPPPPAAMDPEIAKAADEVDSYLALGFVDDAKDVLRDALSRYPGDPSLLERASNLGLDASPKPEEASREEEQEPTPAEPQAAPPDDDLLGGLSFDDLPAPPADPEEVAPGVKMKVSEASPFGAADGIDLGAELSALFDAQPALQEVPEDDPHSSSFDDQSLQDVFNEFKKGVDSQLAEGDYDTRYNLGIAYKEMGLVDEAIAEFQLAAKDPNRSLECSSMIGICFMEKGMADVAVQWYERGLQVQGRAPEEYQGLRYDLGVAFEATGDLAKAEATFAHIVGEDPSFRDASEKLRDLQSRA